jgi:hypothetical protein
MESSLKLDTTILLMRFSSGFAFSRFPRHLSSRDSKSGHFLVMAFPRATLSFLCAAVMV